MRCCERALGLSFCAFEASVDVGGVDVDVSLHFDAVGETGFHFADLANGGGEGFDKAVSCSDGEKGDFDDEGYDATNEECDVSFEEVLGCGSWDGLVYCC